MTLPHQGTWIRLKDFSVRYGVSMSTLRRRVQNNFIEWKWIKGAYWIPNTPDLEINLHRKHKTKCPTCGAINLKERNEKL